MLNEYTRYLKKLISAEGENYFKQIMPDLAEIRKFLIQKGVIEVRIKEEIKKLNSENKNNDLENLNIVQLDYENWITVAYRLLKTLGRVKGNGYIKKRTEYKVIMTLRNHLIDHSDAKDGFNIPSFAVNGNSPVLKPAFSDKSKHKDPGYIKNKVSLDAFLIKIFTKLQRNKNNGY